MECALALIGMGTNLLQKVTMVYQIQMPPFEVDIFIIYRNYIFFHYNKFQKSGFALYLRFYGI